MSLGMDVKPVRVILDTNILISAIGFGGKPREILRFCLENKVKAITSQILIAELQEVISKKFPELIYKLDQIQRRINKKFKKVQPKNILKILNDEDDNRVLEAAAEGKCSYIITGDKELLDLRVFKNIKIVTVDQFLKSVFKG